MSKVQEVTQQLRAIPPEKRRRKTWAVVLGAAVSVAGLLVPKYLGYPWQVGAAICGFGGFIASRELVTAYARFIPAAVRDLLGATKGGE